MSIKEGFIFKGSDCFSKSFSLADHIFKVRKYSRSFATVPLLSLQLFLGAYPSITILLSVRNMEGVCFKSRPTGKAS